jgi:nucleotide-binding universal stress UspA family protein
MTLKTFEKSGLKLDSGLAPIHLKKILVPTDFSDASQHALKYAFRLAEAFSAKLTLLYVFAPPPLPVSLPMPVDLSIRSEILRKDLVRVQKKLNGLSAAGGQDSVVPSKCMIQAGVPSHEIVEIAKSEDADLIVIATHGFTGWKHFCIGSTAERVVRAAPCPVLVVREKEHEFC